MDAVIMFLIAKCHTFCHKIALYLTGKETRQCRSGYTHFIFTHPQHTVNTHTHLDTHRVHPYGHIHTLTQTCCHNRSHTTHTNSQLVVLKGSRPDKLTQEAALVCVEICE